ncbi:MAG TPA: hypothetical protein VKY22_28510 [Bradyrhizobium sp.]|nr:hypothetical protein [Bradyrhizobium sp.]
MSGNGALDYHREAVAAMKLAIAASGFERMRWIRVAQAWQDMAQWTEQRDVVPPSPSIARAGQD